MNRYRVEPGSMSAHCCFEATVVDTHKPHKPYYSTVRGKMVQDYEPVCECMEPNAAAMIAEALNKLSVEDRRMTNDQHKSAFPELRRLHAALLQPMPKGFHWYFPDIEIDAKCVNLHWCGTAGCAIGLYQTTLGKHDDLYEELYLLEMANGAVAWDWIFLGDAYMDEMESLKEVTPQRVAREIEVFLREQGADLDQPGAVV